FRQRRVQGQTEPSGPGRHGWRTDGTHVEPLGLQQVGDGHRAKVVADNHRHNLGDGTGWGKPETAEARAEVVGPSEKSFSPNRLPADDPEAGVESSRQRGGRSR